MKRQLKGMKKLNYLNFGIKVGNPWANAVPEGIREIKELFSFEKNFSYFKNDDESEAYSF